MAMADNYLENRYEDYLARKQKKEAERKAKFRRQLEEYKKKIGYKERVLISAQHQENQ